MTEPIVVWRAEFCELQKTKMDVSFFDGRFLNDRVEILFLGFCIAKRSQPVVVLPRKESPEMTSHDAGYNLGLSECKMAITQSGISYRVGK